MKNHHQSLRHRRGGLSAKADRRRVQTYGEQNGCTGKVRNTEAQARRLAAQRQERTGQVFRAYSCRYGEHWHTGGVRRKLPNGVIIIETVERNAIVKS